MVALRNEKSDVAVVEGFSVDQTEPLIETAFKAKKADMTGTPASKPQKTTKPAEPGAAG